MHRKTLNNLIVGGIFKSKFYHNDPSCKIHLFCDLFSKNMIKSMSDFLRSKSQVKYELGQHRSDNTSKSIEYGMIPKTMIDTYKREYYKASQLESNAFNWLNPLFNITKLTDKDGIPVKSPGSRFSLKKFLFGALNRGERSKSEKPLKGLELVKCDEEENLNVALKVKVRPTMMKC